MEHYKDKYIIREFYTFQPNGDEEQIRKLIKEADQKDLPIIMSGILQKANTLNRNGRVYPYDILRREATNYMKLIEENLAGGELDHPDSAVVSLSNVSHRILDMWWQGEELYGKAMIAYTEAGDKLKGLLKTGFKLGISSRGVGSVKTIKGEDVVQDDFELIAFDFVSSPSTPGAYMFKEARQWGMTPITEEQYEKIKCINGVCSFVNKIDESKYLTQKTKYLKQESVMISENSDCGCKMFDTLSNLSDNDFWKKM